NKENPAIKHLKEITGPAVKTFVMVDPDTSSVGYHAREALSALGIWEEVMKKTTIPKQPSLVGVSVAKGDAQAGIAYYPCMTETHQPGAGPAPKKKVVVAEFVPEELYTRFACTAAVVKGAKNPEEGKKFIAFLQTPEAQAIFAKWNFVDPEKQAKAE
ncbi:MAG: molybdate ABC transporter substrate-binding protein, partial [Armatimonadetes bacterium]|nr:molybdate ABC transporter substrate-binding protein [Armatimonadota bacterium]NIO75520.1 molybdate ABC transporter substrate-binding protein [Armatimonadota bacterium]NIO95897.1 molybdate ABC transporter substrate-binding protein [Armatimonadota bacterium]